MEEMNASRALVEEAHGRRPLGRTRIREDNKQDFRILVMRVESREN
jgi:hypothetical protein